MSRDRLKVTSKENADSARCGHEAEERMAAIDRARVLNFNVGVLGHIDSGKTSLGEQIYSSSWQHDILNFNTGKS